LRNLLQLVLLIVVLLHSPFVFAQGETIPLENEESHSLDGALLHIDGVVSHLEGEVETELVEELADELTDKLAQGLAPSENPSAVEVLLPFLPTTQLAMSDSLFILEMKVVAEIPADYSRYILTASRAYSVDKLDLAAVLISEHSGPDKDFSLEGSLSRDYPQDYDPNSVGQAGEIGLYQIMPRWAKLAGYTKNDLYDPEKNTQVAAFVISTNKAKHIRSCETQKYVYHTWIAHYKCERKDRNKFDGFCRNKQNNWWLLRASLGEWLSPDFNAMRKEQKSVLLKTQKRAARNSMGVSSDFTEE
jgi:hypothetical protein